MPIIVIATYNFFIDAFKSLNCQNTHRNTVKLTGDFNVTEMTKDHTMCYCLKNGGHQNDLSGYTMGTEGIREEAGMTGQAKTG